MQTKLAEVYDVAIIGGGIHGAGAAQAASAAGYKTLLVEMQDWADGTSSRSSKLIHGGLRYLEGLQFKLVKESLQERAILLSIAPELVKPLQFYIPVYRHTRRRPWQLQLGLWLYSLLAGTQSPGGYEKLSPGDFTASPLLDTVGLLDTGGLQSVFSYWDAQTDDRQLTQAVVASAQELGADAFSRTKLTRASQTEQGYQLNLNQQGIDYSCHCQYLINTSGPWVNEVIRSITPQPEMLELDLVKGSHLVIEQAISPQAFYLEAPADQRAVFVLPWKGHSLIGTTEKLYTGDINHVTPDDDEVEYLLATLKRYFPTLTPTVIDQFAGLRVLPKGNSSVFARPRESYLHSTSQQPRLLHLLGGKLTGYRHTAERMVDQVQQQLGPRSVKADTKALLLHPVQH